MDTRILEHFLLACETNSLSVAAKRAFVSRQAFSYEMRRLEQEIGVQLFERTNRGVQLTAAGTLFRDTLGRTFEEVAGALKQMRALDGELHDTVIRFGCNYTYLDTLSSRIIFDFEQECGVRVQTIHIPEMAQCWNQLKTGEIDLALTANLVREVALPFYSSGNQQAYLCVSTKNPLSSRNAVRLPHDIAGLTVGVATESERAAVIAGIGHAGPVVLVPTASITHRMLENNQLVVIAAERQCEDYLSETCARIPIENCALSTLFVTQNDPSPIVELLAQRLSGSTLRRDASNHPLPYQDDPDWPLVR